MRVIPHLGLWNLDGTVSRRWCSVVLLMIFVCRELQRSLCDVVVSDPKLVSGIHLIKPQLIRHAGVPS